MKCTAGHLLGCVIWVRNTIHCSTLRALSTWKVTGPTLSPREIEQMPLSESVGFLLKASE